MTCIDSIIDINIDNNYRNKNIKTETKFFDSFEKVVKNSSLQPDVTSLVVTSFRHEIDKTFTTFMSCLSHNHFFDNFDKDVFYKLYNLAH